ncbi:MAG: YHS domain-containing protein [Ignavibacteria bacterium]|nr:YHS domain-containing protein [Ignavibacteria bacterium]
MNQINFIRDVVCGMYLITTDGCKVSEVKEEKYYFCWDTCKAEFDKNMDKYVDNISVKNDETRIEDKAEWERDPVCDERINISDAKGITLYKNARYYFCCKTCKKEFDANPSAYADKDEGFYDPRNPNDFLDGRFRIL